MPFFLLAGDEQSGGHTFCIYLQVQSGDFVAQRQQEYGFANTACDQVIEQTANRDSKTKVGLTGFSLNKDAVHRCTTSLQHSELHES